MQIYMHVHVPQILCTLMTNVNTMEIFIVAQISDILYLYYIEDIECVVRTSGYFRKQVHMYSVWLPDVGRTC